MFILRSSAIKQLPCFLQLVQLVHTVPVKMKPNRKNETFRSRKWELLSRSKMTCLITASEDVGKPTGNDIREKKLTLPLIYTLNTIDKNARRKIIYMLKNENKNKESINFIIESVIKAGGIKYAETKMNLYRDEALEILYTFDASPVRSALEELVRFTTDRKY
jgi:hypothetical protein